MDRYEGDLTDIIRATGVGGGSSSATEEWQFESNTIGSDEIRVDDFGDPFTHFGDPLLQEIHTGFGFHNSSSINDHVVEQHNGNFGNANFHDDHEMTRKSSSSNIFSRMLQISPAAKLQASPQDAVAPTPMLVPSNVAHNNNNIIINDNNKNNMISSNICKGHVEISSPRNTALKRRKNQAKKVVCIPAPAPANSRPSTGEIVPSDLWAWRKYGQKPIKGSPYPRGYYRCSSSKGCLARKQVERSRTDPNMLVITYTAEHNHPWPTQRNALAGSTRSHHSTKNTTKNNPLINISNAPNAPTPRVTNESELDPNLVAIKEELENDHFEMDDPDFDEGYNPALHDESEQPVDNFFTDFGEIDANPTSLMFGLEYWGGNSGGATTSERSGTAGFYGEAKRDS